MIARKTLIAALLLAIFVIGLAGRSCVAAAPATPISVVVLQECGHTLLVLITYTDGTFERVRPDETNVGRLIDLMKISAHVQIIQSDCTKVGHDSAV